MNLDFADTVVRLPGPVTAPVGEELVMFSVEQGKYFGLNEVAAAIWHRLEYPLPVAALCEQLQEEFDVSPDRCQKEVLQHLDDLHAKGLIQVQSP